MADRAQQALHLLALEPVAEMLADPNAYGFRPGRSAADAIAQCFNILAQRNAARWIFEGDIKACFDQISHTWLREHVPMDKSVLGKWLTAGYMEDGKVYPTKAGTPQGGIASPVLANMALDGLEWVAQRAAPRQKVYVVKCARTPYSTEQSSPSEPNQNDIQSEILCDYRICISMLHLPCNTVSQLKLTD